MGLDSIELIIEIEKAFDISIPDHEAEKLRTVGDLHNSVWNHLVERRSSRCNSQILFYKFRSYLITAIGIEMTFSQKKTGEKSIQTSKTAFIWPCQNLY